MFARDSQMLRNKRHFVINVIAINVFYCNLFKRKVHDEFLVETIWKTKSKSKCSLQKIVLCKFKQCGLWASCIILHQESIYVSHSCHVFDRFRADISKLMWTKDGHSQTWGGSAGLTPDSFTPVEVCIVISNWPT